MKKHILSSFALTVFILFHAPSIHAGPPSVTDVGEVDSFGHNAIYMGAASGFITLSPDCSAEPSPAPTPPDAQCFTLNAAPNGTSFSATNICRINLPKNSTKDLIYPILTFFTDYQLQNSTGMPQPQAIFSYSATLTLVSTVLSDPSIIDPNTGLPANGQLIFVFSPDRLRVDRSLAVNERIRNRFDYSRAGIAGINKAGLVGSGLPQTVVDNLFKNPMTIRMDVTGTAKLATDARITCSMRLFGD